MKKLMVTLLGIVVLCSLCLAQGTGAAPAKKEVVKTEAPATGNVAPLNNIVKMDKDGKRTALCCCLAEFSATKEAPVVTHGTTNFLMCGVGCAEMAKKATPAENEVTLAAWHKKYATYSLASNATTNKEGVKVAKCVCGAEMTVTPTSDCVVENGMTTYVCGKGCLENFTKKTEDERLVTELAYLSATPTK